MAICGSLATPVPLQALGADQMTPVPAPNRFVLRVVDVYMHACGLVRHLVQLTCWASTPIACEEPSGLARCRTRHLIPSLTQCIVYFTRRQPHCTLLHGQNTGCSIKNLAALHNRGLNAAQTEVVSYCGALDATAADDQIGWSWPAVLHFCLSRTRHRAYGFRSCTCYLVHAQALPATRTAVA